MGKRHCKTVSVFGFSATGIESINGQEFRLALVQRQQRGYVRMCKSLQGLLLRGEPNRVHIIAGSSAAIQVGFAAIQVGFPCFAS